MLSDLYIRIRALVRPASVEQELDDELRFHLDAEIEKHMKGGLPRDAAVRRARLEFGGLDQTKEDCREARGIAFIESVVQDVRYGLRAIRRTPAFAATAVLTLGVSTAAIATVFTLYHTLFLRHPPVEGGEELVEVSATREGGRQLGPISYPDYVHLRDSARTLKVLAAHYSSAPLFVTVGDRSGEVNGAVVSTNYFPLLRATPVLGRFFSEAEDRIPDRDRVAVLSFELWRDWFGTSPKVLNSTIRINATSFTVIGVAPQWLRGQGMPVEIYIPTMMLGVGYRFCRNPIAEEGCTILEMIGRVADGRTAEDVRAEVEILRPARWPYSAPGENTGLTAFRPRDGFRTGEDPQARVINLLLGAAVLLLLVCCANLAGLLVSRNAARTREFAVRAAIGANRLRLVRQHLTESLLLAVGGGGIALLMSRAAIGALNSWFYSMDFEGRPLYFDFSPAPAVMSAVFGVLVVATFLFGLVPALSAVGAAQRDGAAREASAVAARSRLGGWLVGAQAAIAVALVAVAALLTFGSWMLINSTPDASGVALMRVRPRLIGYDPKQAQQFQRELVQRLHVVPGVASASPYTFCGTRVSLPNWPDGETLESGCREIGPRYFETIGQSLRGREFGEADVVGSMRVAIVNETLARRLWPHTPALGETLRTTTGPRHVVGVVEDVGPIRRVNQPEPRVYVPFWQNPAQIDARYFVKVNGSAAAMLPSLIREVGRVSPDVPVTETMTLATQAALGASQVRLSATVLGYAAAVALVLTAIGLYGVTAYSVSRRTREIGIRLALGAEPGRLRRVIVRQGMTVIAWGAIGGLGLAAGGTRLIRHLLYGPPTADLGFFLGAGIVVTAVGLLACWLPARRAARIQPAIALRTE